MMNEGYSLADIAAATGNGNNGNNNDGWGGGGWWIILLFILIAGVGGWGNGGGMFGGRGTNTSVYEGYVLNNDFSMLERRIDNVNNGLCDGFYAMNTAFGNLNNTLATNFAAVQQTLTQGFAGLNTGMVQQGYETRIAISNIGTQLAQCCCDLKGIMAETNYNMATQANNLQKQISDCCCETQRQIERGFCEVGYNMQNNTRDIMQSAHADTDRILAKLEQMERTHDAELLANERAKNAALQGALDRQALIAELKGCGCGGCGC